MKNIYKILTSILVFLWVFTISSSVLGAPTANIFRTILPETNNLYNVGSPSMRWANVYSTNVDTTTISIGGSSTGDITIKKADPTLIYDVTTATDTDFWAGVQDDGLGTDNDKYQIGDGTTPGTNPFLTIDTSGNVGIGTTAPLSKLQINGDLSIGTIQASLFDSSANNLLIGSGSGDEGMTIYTGTAAAGYIFFADGTTGSEMFRGSIHYNHASDFMSFWSGGSNTRLLLQGDGDVGIGGAITDTSTLAGASVIIKNSGNVGIGTTAPSAKLQVTGIMTSTMTSVTVAASATAFAETSNVVKVTGDAGGNTVATITGGISGQVLTLIFVDALVTITDTSATTANTVNLSAAFTSSADDTITLVFDGNKWFETARSVN